MFNKPLAFTIVTEKNEKHANIKIIFKINFILLDNQKIYICLKIELNIIN